MQRERYLVNFSNSIRSIIDVIMFLGTCVWVSECVLVSVKHVIVQCECVRECDDFVICFITT